MQMKHVTCARRIDSAHMVGRTKNGLGSLPSVIRLGYEWLYTPEISELYSKIVRNCLIVERND